MILDRRAVDEKLRQFEFDCEYELDLYGQPNFDDIDDEYHPRVDEMIKWCRENCKGRSMYKQDLQFRFQLEEDVVAFKLRFF